VDAANAVGAPVLLVSTDWVFDGTQGHAAEDEPPNPVNAYGCGGEHIDRVGLARRAVDAFALDPALLDIVPPPPGALPPGRVPVDTRLAAARTAERLDMRLPTVDDLLAGLRSELDEARRGAQAT